MVPLPACLVSLMLLASGAEGVRRSRERISESKFIAGVPVLNYHLANEGARGRDGSDSASFGELVDAEQEWVLVLKTGTTTDELARMCKANRKGCNLVGDPSKSGVPFIEMRGTEGDLENVIELAAGAVRYVEPDSQVSMIPVIEVGIQAATWGLTRIGADERGALAGIGATVFVVDTGVRTTHQEFNGRAASALDMTSGSPVECNGNQNCAGDFQGHGTHCAGSAAGETVGVAPSANVRSVKVLRDSGSGDWSWTYGALDWLATNDQRPAVGSMSLGGSGVLQAMQDAIDAAVSSGVAIVVAAGNEDSNSCSFSPAFVPSAITVGSIDSLDQRSSFSNYGPCTNIWAPGTAVYSAGVVDDTAYTTYSGTSMACPHVSGGVALLQGGNPSLNPAQVLAALQTNAERDAISDLQPGDVNLLLSVGEPYTGPPTPAPPTPAPPPPGTWELYGTGCQMEANCISSNNYPWAYGIRESCSVMLYGDIPFRTESFRTEFRYDVLSINGVAYSGIIGPPAGSYTGTIAWATDSATNRGGWKMCRTDQADAPTPPPTPAPPPGWTLYGTGCQEDANCVFSLNYPNNYGNNQECWVELAGTVSLTPQGFQTERYDVLMLSGRRYSGIVGPSAGSYSGWIQWSSDHSTTNMGWKFCTP